MIKIGGIANRKEEEEEEEKITRAKLILGQLGSMVMTLPTDLGAPASIPRSIIGLFSSEELFNYGYGLGVYILSLCSVLYYFHTSFK